MRDSHPAEKLSTGCASEGFLRPRDGPSPSLPPWIADAEPAGNADRSSGDMAPTATIVRFWPAWTRTLEEMIRRLAQARSRCRRCHTLLHVDLEALHRRLGGEASLINRTDACAVVGCEGTVYYLGAVATGAAYHVLVDESALLDGVTDPIATPFRSRWHGMRAIGPDPLPSSSEPRIIDWPGRTD